MHKIILFIFLLFPSFLFAQNINNKYKMRQTDEGTLFFILPYKIPSCAPKQKELKVDVTYLSSRDSITINATLISKDEITLDSICFLYSDHKTINKPQLLFIQRKSNNWIYRFGFKLPYIDIKRAYENESSFKLTIYSKQNQFCYQFGDSKWEKSKKWMNQILHLIDLNSR
ncbi:MAG: hypothetical protein PHI48_10980 [Bacteroidales bacterium]|nr:hypothetical protein [Bacteroidales bacterium]